VETHESVSGSSDASRRDKVHYPRGARVKGEHMRRGVKGRARRFNITDKVIIISVCTTDINRRCQTHKEIIVASLKGWEGGRKAKRSFYIVYLANDRERPRTDRDDKRFITAGEAARIDLSSKVRRS